MIFDSEVKVKILTLSLDVMPIFSEDVSDFI